MKQYYIDDIFDDGGSWDTPDVEAGTLAEACQAAEEYIDVHIDEGSYGQEDGVLSVSVSYAIVCRDDDGEDDEDEDTTYHSYLAALAVDEDAMIAAAGGDPACDHEWTSEGEGGCDENPGVWATGGTTIEYRSHCARCGVRRHEVVYGAQRNPGDDDYVEYEEA